jgi:Protein of unknown function (DUF3800)
MVLYFDEAGNSGQNLLDKDQPVYVLVSHDFSLEEAREILKPIKTKAEEIHFKSLRKYPKYQKPLAEVLNHDSICYERIKIAYYVKDYALCAHLADQLVETVYYHVGLNFNAEWRNVKYALGLYLSTIHAELAEEYTELLVLFQKMIRSKQQADIEEFYIHAHMMYSRMENEGEKSTFFPILMSQDHTADIMGSINKFSLDLSLAGLMLLADIWYKQSGEKLQIVHDESKQVAYWSDYIHYVSKELGEEKIEIGYDTRKMVFPVQIDTVTLIDSKDSEQVQLSDIIGSSFAHYAKNILLGQNPQDKVATIIAGTKLAQMQVHPMEPDLSVLQRTEFDTSGDIDPLDYFAQQALKNEEGLKRSYPRS